MAKPIFTIGVPIIYVSDRHELMKTLQKDMADRYSDYYVLLYPSFKDEPVFQVFYEKDMIDINFDELKQIITTTMNNYAKDNKNN